MSESVGREVGVLEEIQAPNQIDKTFEESL